MTAIICTAIVCAAVVVCFSIWLRAFPKEERIAKLENDVQRIRTALSVNQNIRKVV